MSFQVTSASAPPIPVTTGFLSRVVVEEAAATLPKLYVGDITYEPVDGARLGKGTFGKVYAYQLENEADGARAPRNIALKTFKVPADVDHEARVIDRLDRFGFPCGAVVVTAMPANPIEGLRALIHSHIVMELMYGSLSSFRGMCNNFLALDLVLQTCSACMCLLETCGLFYLDVKPENALYTHNSSGEIIVRLGDLGSCYTDEEKGYLAFQKEEGDVLPATYRNPWDVTIGTVKDEAGIERQVSSLNEDMTTDVSRRDLYERVMTFGLAILLLQLLPNKLEQEEPVGLQEIITNFSHKSVLVAEKRDEFLGKYPRIESYVNTLDELKGALNQDDSNEATDFMIGLLTTEKLEQLEKLVLEFKQRLLRQTVPMQL